MGVHFHTLAQTTPDPGILGPLAVTKVEYDLGDAVAPLDSLPIPAEARASIHYPTTLTGGPFPVIILLHGRHSTCYNTTSLAASSAWPCPTGRLPIESFQGYDYHARFMASHGYIVVSISCNAINARDGAMANNGMPARGQLVQHHLNLLNTYNTGATSPLTAEIGSSLVGKFDLQRVGMMGHSRGGEGVVFGALLNRSLGSPYGIKAIITLAPVDFKRKILNGIPMLNIAPYCDGDVSDLQGVHFYDDARYTDLTDEAPKHNIVMIGGNHNFYNTTWTPGSYIAGTSDDANSLYGSTHAFCGSNSATSGRIDTTVQKAAYNSYASAFFRMYVGGDTTFAPILETRDLVPPASSMLDTDNVYVSYHPGRTDRRDINRIDTVYNETNNTMGGAVTSSGLVSSGICGGGLAIPVCGIATNFYKEPHKGATGQKGLAQMGLRWDNATDQYQNDIPASQQDITYMEALQFRAAIRYDQSVTGLDLDYTVQLIDSAGAVSSQKVHDHSYALYYPPGTHATYLPKVMFNSIRIPISSFTGIDLKKVRKVKFLFDRSAAGSILISDLSFVAKKCGKLNSTFAFAYDTVGYDISFFDTLSYNTGDTVKWLWRFGNPTSGTSDTSTAHNPSHVFTGAGTYTVCLSVYAKRINQRICTDTFCTTITVVPAIFVTDVNERPNITIYPNPARDQIYIAGAERTDVLRLVNQLGQVVLTTEINEPMVWLPTHLANGMYHAIVTTSRGQVHQRLVINR
ncbi:hypothetical protein GCM10023093_22720 [Nemorincola caseinilytica]|uniref:PKD domain-containing protein n=1 Tax=Nemorincola caseinilytica TaxID=2054315 RepID=A0ABP8NL79_9BACT